MSVERDTSPESDVISVRDVRRGVVQCVAATLGLPEDHADVVAEAIKRLASIRSPISTVKDRAGWEAAITARHGSDVAMSHTAATVSVAGQGAGAPADEGADEVTQVVDSAAAAGGRRDGAHDTPAAGGDKRAGGSGAGGDCGTASSGSAGGAGSPGGDKRASGSGAGGGRGHGDGGDDGKPGGSNSGVPNDGEAEVPENSEEQEDQKEPAKNRTPQQPRRPGECLQQPSPLGKLFSNSGTSSAKRPRLEEGNQEQDWLAKLLAGLSMNGTIQAGGEVVGDWMKGYTELRSDDDLIEKLSDHHLYNLNKLAIALNSMAEMGMAHAIGQASVQASVQSIAERRVQATADSDMASAFSALLGAIERDLGEGIRLCIAIFGEAEVARSVAASEEQELAASLTVRMQDMVEPLTKLAEVKDFVQKKGPLFGELADKMFIPTIPSAADALHTAIAAVSNTTAPASQERVGFFKKIIELCSRASASLQSVGLMAAGSSGGAWATRNESSRVRAEAVRVWEPGRLSSHLITPDGMKHIADCLDARDEGSSAARPLSAAAISLGVAAVREALPVPRCLVLLPDFFSLQVEGRAGTTVDMEALSVFIAGRDLLSVTEILVPVQYQERWSVYIIGIPSADQHPVVCHLEADPLLQETPDSVVADLLWVLGRMLEHRTGVKPTWSSEQPTKALAGTTHQKPDEADGGVYTVVTIAELLQRLRVAKPAWTESEAAAAYFKLPTECLACGVLEGAKGFIQHVLWTNLGPPPEEPKAHQYLWKKLQERSRAYLGTLQWQPEAPRS